MPYEKNVILLFKTKTWVKIFGVWNKQIEAVHEWNRVCEEVKNVKGNSTDLGRKQKNETAEEQW